MTIGIFENRIELILDNGDIKNFSKNSNNFHFLYNRVIYISSNENFFFPDFQNYSEITDNTQAPATTLTLPTTNLELYTLLKPFFFSVEGETLTQEQLDAISSISNKVTKGGDSGALLKVGTKTSHLLQLIVNDIVQASISGTSFQVQKDLTAFGKIRGTSSLIVDYYLALTQGSRTAASTVNLNRTFLTINGNTTISNFTFTEGDNYDYINFPEGGTGGRCPLIILLFRQALTISVNGNIRTSTGQNITTKPNQVLFFIYDTESGQDIFRQIGENNDTIIQDVADIEADILSILQDITSLELTLTGLQTDLDRKISKPNPEARAVQIKGFPEQNEVLEVVYDFVSEYGIKEGLTTFKWYRNDIEIIGATAKTYTLALADVGQVIKAGVTPADNLGTLGALVQSANIEIDSRQFGVELIPNGRIFLDDNFDETPNQCTKGSNTSLRIYAPDNEFTYPSLEVEATNTTSKFLSIQSEIDSVPLKLTKNYLIRVGHKNAEAGILKASGSGVFGGGNKTLPVTTNKENIIVYEGAITGADCRPQVEPTTTGNKLRFWMSVKEIL